MLITRIGNDEVEVEITETTYSATPKYAIILGEASNIESTATISYEDIDDAIAIILKAKKMIEEEMESDAKNKAEAEKAKELAENALGQE